MSAFLAAARVLPFGFGGRRALLLIERNLFVYRNGWLVILSGFFEPLFYLLAIGLGIGGMVGDVPGPERQPIPYAMFVAPALLATASMNGAIAESTFNVFFKLNYQKTYDAVLVDAAGPGRRGAGRDRLGRDPGDAVRAGLHGGDPGAGAGRRPRGRCSPSRPRCCSRSPSRRPGWPRRRSCARWQDFDLINLVVLPLFLFSGTFYPIAAYPRRCRCSSASRRCGRAST